MIGMIWKDIGGFTWCVPCVRFAPRPHTLCEGDVTVESLGMSVGHEEARVVDGAGCTSPVRPGHPLRSRFARPRPLTLREGDGLHGDDVRGIGYRAWDFWVRRSWLLWVLAALVLLLDQSTKSVIVAWLDWGDSWPAEGLLRITHARNTGTAFSLFQGHSNILSLVAIFAVAVLLWVYATTGAKSLILRIALGLQLGGALGNLIDRLQQGYVTDFLDVGPWPIFNVADSAISVGMVLMVWYFVMTRNEEADVSAASSVADVAASGCARCADARRYGTLHGAVQSPGERI